MPRSSSHYDWLLDACEDSEDEPLVTIYRNTGINLLPNEILSQIMTHITFPEYDEFGRMVRHSSPRGWKNAVQLSLVCRRWRSIALTTRAVWSYVCNPRNASLRAMLLRSGSAPITLALTDVRQLLKVDNISGPRLQDLRICFPSYSRSRNRELIRMEHSWGQQFAELPTLESVTLIADDVRAQTLLWPIFAMEKLFSTPKPSLRHLVLLNCALPDDLAIPIFDQLRTFSYTLKDEKTHPQVPELLQLLASMPQLGSLSIFLGHVHVEEQSDSPPETRVPLHQLTSIKLTMAVTHCKDIVKGIDAPSLEKEKYSLHFDLTEWAEDPQDLDDVLDNIGISDETVVNQRSFSHAAFHHEPNWAELKLWNADPVSNIFEADIPDSCPMTILFKDSPASTESLCAPGLLNGISHNKLGLRTIIITEFSTQNNPTYNSLQHRHMEPFYMGFFWHARDFEDIQFRSCLFPSSLVMTLSLEAAFDFGPFLKNMHRLSFHDVVFNPESNLSTLSAFLSTHAGYSEVGLREVAFSQCKNLSFDTLEELDLGLSERVPSAKVTWEGVYEEYDYEWEYKGIVLPFR